MHIMLFMCATYSRLQSIGSLNVDLEILHCEQYGCNGNSVK